MLKRTPIRKVRSKPRPGRLKGKAMESLRREVFERDGYRCQHTWMVDYWNPLDGTYMPFQRTCGKEVTWENGHLAHIISRGRGGPDTPENTCCKCSSCHIGIEHSYGPSGVKPVPKKPIDTDLV